MWSMKKKHGHPITEKKLGQINTEKLGQYRKETWPIHKETWPMWKKNVARQYRKGTWPIQKNWTDTNFRHWQFFLSVFNRPHNKCLEII